MKKSKRIVCIALICIVMSAVHLFETNRNVRASVWQGDYSVSTGYSLKDNRCEIDSPEGFAYFAQDVNNGNTYRGIQVILKSDIDMGNLPFSGIGTSSSIFEGSFFGNNHSISNLLLQGKNGCGCFNYIGGTASINQLIIDNANVLNDNCKTQAALVGEATGEDTITILYCTIKNSVIKGAENTGGLIGFASAPMKISNCNIQDCTIINGSKNCSGGFVAISNHSIEFSNCSFHGDLTSGGSKCGGFLGDGKGETYTFSDCSSFGSIKATGASAGGLVGYYEASGTIAFLQCGNAASIEGTKEIAGIIGYSKGTATFESCYNSGPVTALKDSGSYDIGSAAGILANSGKVSLSFTDCVNNAVIIGKRTVGGICGDAGSGDNVSFLRCCNRGDITDSIGRAAGICANSESQGLETFESCINYGNISAESFAAGIVNSNDTALSILRCANFGTVYTKGKYSCGGIVSSNKGITKECFNMGEIYSSSSDSGSAGGIQGAYGKVIDCYNGGNIHTAKHVAGIAASDATAISCYNYGTISDGSHCTEPIICESTCSSQNCYYVGEKKSDLQGSQMIPGTLKSAQMISALNPAAFTQDENNKNNGYPLLGWWNAVSFRPGNFIHIEEDIYQNTYGEQKKLIPEDAALFNGSYYKVYYEAISWTYANYICNSLGGHLATITSREEQDFIESLNPGKTWIGASKKEDGTWGAWVTGEDWSYTNWSDGEPNNSSNVVPNENHAVIWNPKWNDLNDNNTKEQKGYICEWDIDSIQVTYDYNGGILFNTNTQILPETTKSKPNTTLILKESFALKDGYAFGGWGTTKDAASGYLENSEFKLGYEDITFYAIWLTDTDGDGFADVWEKDGYDADGNGDPDIDLKAMGADPEIPDIFVQVDWMVIPKGLFTKEKTLKPSATAIQLVSNAFSNHGIHLHIIEGKEIAYQKVFDPGDQDDYYQNWLANNDIALEKTKRTIFHHCLFCNTFLYNDNTLTTGLSNNTPGQYFLIAAGLPLSHYNRTSMIDVSDVTVASTFMHELGHNLGLKHGGNTETNYNPNHISVMNYSFQMSGIKRTDGSYFVDYSNMLLDPLNEAALIESDGLNPKQLLNNTNLMTTWGDIKEDIERNRVWFNAAGSIDYNRNGTIDDTPVSVDLNENGNSNDVLTGCNDWAMLIDESAKKYIGPIFQLRFYSSKELYDFFDGYKSENSAGISTDPSPQLTIEEAFKNDLFPETFSNTIVPVCDSYFSDIKDQNMILEICNLRPSACNYTLSLSCPALFSETVVRSGKLEGCTTQATADIICIPIVSAPAEGTYTIAYTLISDQGCSRNGEMVISFESYDKNTLDTAKEKLENEYAKEIADIIMENIEKCETQTDISSFLLGDIDNNGKITAADARLALRIAVGLDSAVKNTAKFTAGDVNHDNKITAADARLILRAAVGLESLS